MCVTPADSPAFVDIPASAIATPLGEILNLLTRGEAEIVPGRDEGRGVGSNGLFAVAVAFVCTDADVRESLWGKGCPDTCGAEFVLGCCNACILARFKAHIALCRKRYITSPVTVEPLTVRSCAVAVRAAFVPAAILLPTYSFVAFSMRLSDLLVPRLTFMEKVFPVSGFSLNVSYISRPVCKT